MSVLPALGMQVIQPFTKRTILLGAGVGGLLAVIGVRILSSGQQPLPINTIELPTAQSSASGRGFSRGGDYESKATFQQGLSKRTAESLIREWLVRISPGTA